MQRLAGVLAVAAVLGAAAGQARAASFVSSDASVSAQATARDFGGMDEGDSDSNGASDVTSFTDSANAAAVTPSSSASGDADLLASFTTSQIDATADAIADAIASTGIEAGGHALASFAVTFAIDAPTLWSADLVLDVVPSGGAQGVASASLRAADGTIAFSRTLDAIGLLEEQLTGTLSPSHYTLELFADASAATGLFDTSGESSTLASLSLSLTPVPEPEAGGLVALGVAWLGTARRASGPRRSR